MLCGVGCDMGCDVGKGILLSSPEGGSNLWLVDVLRALLMVEWVLILFVSEVRIFQVFSATPTQYPFFSLDAEGKA